MLSLFTPIKINCHPFHFMLAFTFIHSLSCHEQTVLPSLCGINASSYLLLHTHQPIPIFQHMFHLRHYISTYSSHRACLIWAARTHAFLSLTCCARLNILPLPCSLSYPFTLYLRTFLSILSLHQLTSRFPSLS